MGISDDDLDNLTSEMMSAFGGAEGMEGLMAQPDGGDDEQDDGRTATFPFLSQLFGGGSGAGVTVSPVCFLVIGKDGSANILGINAQASDTVDRLVEMIPGAINKVSNFVSGFKGKTEDAAEVAETLSGDE